MSLYRPFSVDRIVPQSASAKSFYLVPKDGGPLAPFAPGQHLPLRLMIPGQSEPTHRFYTLSDCENGMYYRLTIKKELPRADRPGSPGGLSSTYFNDIVRVGDVIQAKAPAGNFFLDLQQDHPVVFIAGGIGVTPFLSMLNAVARHQPTREVWFFFAVRHGGDHVFKDHLFSIANRHPTIRSCVLYDQATPDDRLGIDYLRPGRIDVPLLSATLPSLQMEYYICGPTPMMKTLVSGLLAAGLKDTHIRTESFGPSSSAFAQPPEASVSTVHPTDTVTVTFQRSKKSVPWTPATKSLWELAESSGVEIDSGCLYGDCGTCTTRLLDGRVQYIHPTAAKPDPGMCLPCSCRPVGSVVLDA